MSVWTWEVILTSKSRYRLITWQLITLFTSKFHQFWVTNFQKSINGTTTFIRHWRVLSDWLNVFLTTQLVFKWVWIYPRWRNLTVTSGHPTPNLFDKKYANHHLIKLDVFSFFVLLNVSCNLHKCAFAGSNKNLEINIK